MHDEIEMAVIEAEEDAEGVIVPEQFAVRDADTADWLVRKLIEAEAHIRRVKRQADREIRRTQHEHNFLMMRYGRQLEAWAKNELSAVKARRKSLNLLSGTVGFRTVASKLVVEDQNKAVAWAKRRCKSAVVTVERLSKSELKGHFAKSGEVPAGVHVEPSREAFYVK